MMLYSLAKKNFMFIAVFAGILRAKFPSLLKRDGNAIAFQSRAIARDGVKHILFFIASAKGSQTTKCLCINKE